MTDREQYAPSPAAGRSFAGSGPLTWMLSNATSRPTRGHWRAVTVVLIVYPIARIVIPAVLNGIVPEVVRTVLNLI